MDRVREIDDAAIRDLNAAALVNMVRGWEDEKKRERDEKRRDYIAALPRVQWFCWTRDWEMGWRQIGARWGKRLNAGEGDLIYQHHFEVRIWWPPIRVHWC